MLLLAVTAAADNDVRVVRLENVRKEWQNAYGAIIYTVLADVENVSEHLLQSVRVPALLKNRFPAKKQGGRHMWHLLPRAGIKGHNAAGRGATRGSFPLAVEG